MKKKKIKQIWEPWPLPLKHPRTQLPFYMPWGLLHKESNKEKLCAHVFSVLSPESTLYNVLSMQHATYMFLIWRVQVCVSVISHFFHPGMV